MTKVPCRLGKSIYLRNKEWYQIHIEILFVGIILRNVFKYKTTSWNIYMFAYINSTMHFIASWHLWMVMHWKAIEKVWTIYHFQ